jgi:hypothetical protein
MNKFQKKAVALMLCLSFFTIIGCNNPQIKSKDNKNNKDKPKVTEKSYDKRVLFLGNSYTYYHDLPDMFMLLSKSGGYNVLADSITEPVASLAIYNDTESKLGFSDILNDKLKNKWDIVMGLWSMGIIHMRTCRKL